MITSSSQIGKFYQINAVQTCDTAEGVAGAHAVAPGGVSGYTAIKLDMLDGTNGCVHNCNGAFRNPKLRIERESATDEHQRPHFSQRTREMGHPARLFP
jgi:hypothetical protein